jgi:hypothetical protein
MREIRPRCRGILSGQSSKALTEIVDALRFPQLWMAALPVSGLVDFSGISLI